MGKPDGTSSARGQSIALLGLVVFLTGCVTPFSSDPITLLAINSSMNHNGSGGVSAVPEHDGPQPARCSLFRDGILHVEDTCEVRRGPYDDVDVPWHVGGAWTASEYPLDDPRRWSEKTIEAFDGRGRLVAHWDGAKDYHPDHMRAIE